MPEQSVVSAFLEHGALGLLALMELVAVIALWRRLNASQEARIAEMGKLVQVAEGVRDALDKLTSALASRRRPQ